MTVLILSASLVVAAYFIGSIPFGVLFARRRGVNIRKAGSGNIGATNVARTLGKTTGALVLLLDAIKGAVPALAAARLAAAGAVDPFAVAAAGFAAICGHCFPVWLDFRGGKGVATSLGVMGVLAPMVTAIGVAIFVALYAAFRVASIGSITAAVAFVPLLVATGASDELVALAVMAALVIIVKHRGNIIRLMRRQEHRV